MIFLGLGIFTASGGFENTQIIGGTTLEDSFGSVDSSGYATMPNLVGMTNEEALAALEEVGLVGEIGEWEFSSPEDGGYVSSQDATAGSQQLLGNTVTYTLNVGNPLEAIESGLLPNLMEMDYMESLDILQNARWNDTYFITEFVYSTEEEKGHILDIVYEDIYPEDDSDYMLYVVSIGIGEESNKGERSIELAYLDFWSRTLTFVVGSSTADSETSYYDYNADVYVSVDGGEHWELIKESMSLSGYNVNEEESSIRVGMINIFDCVGIYNEDYQDIALSFKIDLKSSQSGSTIDSAVADGTITYGYDGELVVDTVSELSPDEAYAVYEAGAISHSQEYYFSDEYCLESGYTTYWKLTGDFEIDMYYRVIPISSEENGYVQSTYVECMKEGELYLAWDVVDIYNPVETDVLVYCDSVYFEDRENKVYESVKPADVTLPQSSYASYEVEEIFEENY